MNLDKLLNKAIADNMDESDFIESLKVNTLEFPEKSNDFEEFLERLNHYLVTTNISDNNNNPFKNIDAIFDILISKKQMNLERKNTLFMYAIYFGCSNNILFDSIEPTIKSHIFYDYLSYRYGRFVNAYNASIMTADYVKEQVAEEICSAFDKGLIKKKNIDAALIIFKLDHTKDNGKIFQDFMEGFDKGYIKIKIQEEKNSINHVLNDSLSKQNESYNKKRL